MLADVVRSGYLQAQTEICSGVVHCSIEGSQLFAFVGGDMP